MDLVIPADQTLSVIRDRFVLGFDCSNWQGDIDWPQVAGLRRPDGRRLFQFVWIKACEDRWSLPNGTLTGPYHDTKFRRNWEAAARWDFYRFPYNYAHPETTEPAVSVTLLEDELRNVGGLQPGDCPMLDMESGGGDLSRWNAEWIDLCTRVLWLPAFYSGHWFMGRRGLETAGVGGMGCPLALASYQAMLPPVPDGWPKIDFWQFTANGKVPGILGPVDLDVYLGDTTGLDKMCKPLLTS